MEQPEQDLRNRCQRWRRGPGKGGSSSYRRDDDREDTGEDEDEDMVPEAGERYVRSRRSRRSRERLLTEFKQFLDHHHE